MAERPLLLFPTPESASRSTLGSGGRTKKQNPQQQWERLSPVFQQLQKAIEARRLEIEQSIAGVEPEQVLVIETVGSVDEFVKAVRHINGLEWLGEIEIDEFEPDEGFLDSKQSSNSLAGRLYLIMTNQQALQQMISLWNSYRSNPDERLPRGLGKFKDVFLQLNDIRPWDVRERLIETGVIEDWKRQIEYDRSEVLPFEIELWFRSNDTRREEGANYVKKLVGQQNGRILAQSVIQEISYHGILAELPVEAIQAIADVPDTELVKCDNVMFFRPTGQIVVGDVPPIESEETIEFEQAEPDTADPIVAILDGLPLSNHEFLSGRLVIDDPDEWANDYLAIDRIHGTSIASLVVHGDLNQHSRALSRPVYVRPIIKPIGWISPPRPEFVPQDCLVVDLVHRAVKRIFEGESDNIPVAPHIKIINLSIGDKSRQFSRSMSPLAKLLDWLSEKYKVLFVVSAGNHSTDISLNYDTRGSNSQQSNKMESAIIDALLQNSSHRKILSPAETVNGLTVGSIHQDYSKPADNDHRIDPFNKILPSPVSAFGSGYRRAIKPDLVYLGGKQYYELNPNINSTISPSQSRDAPGNRVAMPGMFAGKLDNTAYSRGTSNATALISREASFCYDTLRDIFNFQAPHEDFEKYEIPLIKSMLVHGCSWGEIGQNLKQIIENSNYGEKITHWVESKYAAASAVTNQLSRMYDTLLANWIGYGYPQTNRVLECTPQRATLIGYGELNDGGAHVFQLPIPSSLGEVQVHTRLTVTLAWLSPVLPKTQKYRTSSLWFEVNDTFFKSRQDADWQTVRRGTVQHEIFESTKTHFFIHEDDKEIKVNCRNDAGEIQHSIPYGIVVTLEVGEEIDIDIYSEIRARIRPPVPILQSPGQGTV